MPAWSYSALNSFQTCAKQYHEVKVLKNFSDNNETNKWGDRVHKYMASALLEPTDPGTEFRMYDAVVERFRQMPGTCLVEQQLAINNAYESAQWFGQDVWCRGIVDALWIDGNVARAVDWKGLPLGTPLPTPRGWTTMVEVCKGDQVIGGDGLPCKVIGKSQVSTRECFRIEFDDKTVVECDDVHLWKLLDGSVVPVTQLKLRQKMPIAKPVLLPHVTDLPIDPYVLGIWLADGKHSTGEVTKSDSFIWDEIERRGYELGKTQGVHRGACRGHTIRGIKGLLRKLSMPHNKHIPPVYLRASFTQRLDLLRGLMDGDGNANPTRKQAVFTTCSKRLSDDVKQLLQSLGQRVNQATTTQKGFGLTVKAYPLAFRPQGLNPFLLSRKAKRIDPAWGVGNSNYRCITRIEPIGVQQTQCIAVDSADHTYLCTKDFLVTHNTGKRKPDSKQLKIFALLIFAHYPEVERVNTAFVWLQTGKVDTERFHRKDIPVLWQDILPEVRRFELAHKNQTWTPKPSGLCRGWCPVTTCSFNEEAARR